MPALSVMLLANWGLGREVLDCLVRLPGVRVCVVVTRRASEGDDPWANAVYDRAMALGIPVVEEHSFSPADMPSLVRKYGVDIAVAHAHMRILPREAFAAPALGTLNIHASLLPRHRGAHPVEAALAAGDDVTGLTAHLMDEGVDTGPVVHQVSFSLMKDDTLGTVIERQKVHVRELLETALGKLGGSGAAGNFENIP